MTPEEKDYQEALRRIQEAQTKAVVLNLGGLENLTSSRQN
jgi:hypothetical protein